MTTHNKSSDKETEEKKKTIFIICPIGDVDSPERKRSDKVMRHLIAPQFPDFTILRSDLMSYPGSITYQIVAAIESADLVIVDMTDHNPNVFYEMAIAHGFRKPVVHLISDGFNIPFDVSHMRAIYYDLTDPDRVVEARELVKEYGDAAMADPNSISTPISQANAFQLRASDGDNQRILMTDFLQEMREMWRNDFSTISRDRFISKPTIPARDQKLAREIKVQRILEAADEVISDQLQSIDNRRRARTIRNEVLHKDPSMNTLNSYEFYLTAAKNSKPAQPVDQEESLPDNPVGS